MRQIFLYTLICIGFWESVLWANAPTFDGELSLKQLVQKSSIIVYAECSLVTENSGESFSYYNFNVVELLSDAPVAAQTTESYAAGDSFTLRLINIGTGEKVKIKNNLPVFKVGKGYFLFLKDKTKAGYPVIAGGFSRGVIPEIDQENESSLAFLEKSEKIQAADSPKALAGLNKKGASLQQIKDLVQAAYAQE
jgi:hypothetical protein